MECVKGGGGGGGSKQAGGEAPLISLCLVAACSPRHREGTGWRRVITHKKGLELHQ